MEDDILIDNYLKGLLSKDEEKSFLERLVSDVAFNAKFKLEEQLFNALDGDSWSYAEKESDEVQAYKKILDTDDLQDLKKTLVKANSEFNSKPSSSSRKLYYYLTAASIVILLGFQLFFKQKASNQELYHDFIGLNELPTFISRDDKTSKLSEAQILFENRKYEEALAIFQLQSYNSNNAGNVLIYKGITHLELGNYNAAENAFNDLINSDLLDAEKGYWYKGLLFLKQDRVEDTKVVLNTIITKNLFNNSKAEALIEELD